MVREKKVIKNHRLFKNWSKEWLFWLILIILFLITYGHWFRSGNISWGDWYSWPDQALKEWQQFNIWWDQEGLGRSFFNQGSAIWAPFFSLQGWLVSLFHLTYSTTSKLIWFLPFALFGLFGMRFFWQTVFPTDHKGWFLATVIYTLNTYILLIAMGGHISIAVLDMFTPILVATTIRAVREKEDNFFWLFLAAIFWIIASYYEIRIILISAILTAIVFFASQKNFYWLKLIRSVLFILISTILAHIWWVVPFLNQREAESIPSSHLIVDTSYLNLNHTLFLYHSQWPKNILGTMAEPGLLFALFPVLIVLIVGIIGWQKKYYRRELIIFFFLYLIGVFLAKGANPPLAYVYEWLFAYIPIFKFFRDASKFFLIAIFSASIILGLGFGYILRHATQVKIAASLLTVIVAMIALFSNTIKNNFGGTFQINRQPDEYQALDQKLINDQEFYRLAWLPKISRFAYFSHNHPRVSVIDLIYGNWRSFISSPDDLAEFMASPIANFLSDTAGLKYFVVPLDSQNDIYKDYQPEKYYLSLLDQVNWLKKEKQSKISFYKNAHIYPKISTSLNLDLLNNAEAVSEFLKARSEFSTPAALIAKDKKLKGQIPAITNSWLAGENWQAISTDTFTADLIVFQEDNYQLLTKNEDFLVSLNGQFISANGYKKLTPGIYKLKIISKQPLGESVNLTQNYQLMSDCPMVSSVEKFNQLAISPETTLTSNGVTSCLSVNLPDIKPNEAYLIQLKTEIIGQGNLVLRYQDTGGADVSIDKTSKELIDPNLTLNFYSSQQVGKSFFTVSLNGSLVKLKVKDFQLITFPKPPLARDFVFQSEDKLNAPSQIQPQAKILIDKPSHYQLEFNQNQAPFYLTLSAAYHPDWQATLINQNNQPIILDKHFEVNGWANGWFVPKNDQGYKINLDFKPNQNFQKTKYLSSIWLITLIALLIYALVSRKPNLKQS